MAPIVYRALTETVVSIGQLTPLDIKDLNKAVRDGVLARGKGGPYPTPKTVYAPAGHNFTSERLAWVRYFTEAL